MAESAALIGVASAAITFLEFSTRLCRVVRQIRKACGELPPEIQTCHQLIVLFGRMLARLQRFSQLKSGSHGPPTELDSDLDFVVAECRKSGEELLALLDKIKPKVRCYGKSNTWIRDMQTTLRVARKEGKLRKLEQDLRGFKNDLCFILNERVLIAANATRYALPL